MILPPEVWENIFDYSDAISLMNLRAVCTLWQDIIDTILKRRDHWYRQCVKDVPTQFWYIFLEKLDPKIQIDKIARNDTKKWMTMYKSWLIGKHVQNCNTEIGKFEALPKHSGKQEITCMGILNNLMAVGTTNGYVYVYDINRLDEAPIFTADNLEFVTSVKFVGSYHIWLVSCSLNNNVKFWNIELKKLVKERNGRLMCTNYYNLCVAMGRGFYVDSLNSGPLYELHYASHFIVLLALFKNDVVTIYTEKGSYSKHSLADPQVTFSSIFLKAPTHVREFYAFKPEIIAYIKECGSIGFAVEGKKWHRYHVDSQLKLLNGTPTTLLIYGHLLILGLNIGTIHMYYFEDFEKLDFTATNAKVIALNQSAITCMEIFFHEEDQYLAVAQPETVHIVQFLAIQPETVL